MKNTDVIRMGMEAPHGPCPCCEGGKRTINPSCPYCLGDNEIIVSAYATQAERTFVYLFDKIRTLENEIADLKAESENE